jgi:hypothetical protein
MLSSVAQVAEWQTRQVQDLVGVYPVEVRPLSWALGLATITDLVTDNGPSLSACFLSGSSVSLDPRLREIYAPGSTGRDG